MYALAFYFYKEIVGEEEVEVEENPVVIDLVEEIVGEDLPEGIFSRIIEETGEQNPVVIDLEEGEEIEGIEEEEIEEIVREEEKEEALSYNMLAYMSDLCKATDDELMQIICTDEELDTSNLIGEDEVMVKIGEDWSDEDLKTPMNVSIF